jgi:hypothetical protein
MPTGLSIREWNNDGPATSNCRRLRLPSANEPGLGCIVGLVANTANDDPVRAKRAKIAKWTLLANRIGYLLLALLVSLFVIGFAVGFNGAFVGVIVALFAVSAALLAPSIVLGYAVKAAERDDRERGL